MWWYKLVTLTSSSGRGLSPGVAGAGEEAVGDVGLEEPGAKLCLPATTDIQPGWLGRDLLLIKDSMAWLFYAFVFSPCLLTVQSPWWASENQRGSVFWNKNFWKVWSSQCIFVSAAVITMKPCTKMLKVYNFVSTLPGAGNCCVWVRVIELQKKLILIQRLGLFRKFSLGWGRDGGQ